MICGAVSAKRGYKTTRLERLRTGTTVSTSAFQRMRECTNRMPHSNPHQCHLVAYPHACATSLPRTLLSEPPLHALNGAIAICQRKRYIVLAVTSRITCSTRERTGMVGDLC